MPSQTNPTSPATRQDVAREAGVSLATAALALNNHPRVSQATRERVALAAARIGFVPNHAARRLARSQARGRAQDFDQVGLIYLVPADMDPDLPFLATLGGAEHRLSQRHTSLLIVRVSSHEDWAKIDRITRLGSVDGWLLTGLVDDGAVRTLEQKGLPYVVLGDHRCSTSPRVVNIDHDQAGRMAAQHLFDLGHRHVMALAGSMRHVYQQQTVKGFAHRAKELGMTAGPVLTSIDLWRGDTPRNHQSAAALTRWLTAQKPMPTALFITEPGWSERVFRTLEVAGMEVPGQISVISCETDVARARNQKLAHIAMPMAQIGAQGALLLEELVLRPNEKPASKLIAPLLLDGWSAAVLKP